MKSAVVTGGAEGIGAGMARRLAYLGYNVTLLDINFSKAQELVGFRVPMSKFVPLPILTT